MNCLVLIGLIAASAFRYETVGNLEETRVVGDANCDGNVSVGDISGFLLALSNPAGYAAQYPNCNQLQAAMNGDGALTVADIGLFVQLTSLQNASVTSVFVYDAENRLITLEPKYVSAGVTRTRFEYDALGRRIRKWREECTATSPLTWTPNQVHAGDINGYSTFKRVALEVCSQNLRLCCDQSMSQARSALGELAEDK